MTTFEELKSKKTPLAVVGLGYVGLPLAVALAEHFSVIGFDISDQRVKELSEGIERTGEVEPERLKAAPVEFTSDPKDLSRAGLVIVAVPTPIDANRRPEIRPVTGATRTVGQNMSKGTVVVYESTVYPGLTEEICVPILEQESGMEYGTDFFVGYSPERINPGDKVHTLESIIKVVAGQDEATADLLCKVYASVVKAGVHRASSIRVAEAAKVIENTQRDLNIALMNELAHIFDRMDIDTLEVLEAAGTKWNFLNFRPGLVGGHCIGVDPYYLTFKAEEMGFHPQVILAGRNINDHMGKWVAEKLIKKLIAEGCLIKGARIGVLGLTFKENVPDLRNTKVVDIIHELKEYGTEILVHDPLADKAEAVHEYGLTLSELSEFKDLDGLILAVSHEDYKKLDSKDLAACFRNPEHGVFFDLKGIRDKEDINAAGLKYWRI
ncbi:nucleotide sugar dehydrogenase [Desulfobaculum bizertense]|uniref:UDP-N-acetyl-D-galactosamine dehydrogenase n=1 Tax=Desulfobaculum bizertense DSM 18034 TaxID=1121442 RepID=A0A1T4WTU3_9BACT|nr:nucleotide sugar dehydrogenase [Desulfobaculum bizertense]SKA80278.1 UDP-N-acetyl-D-galactosamine dehydrogenase [Desulfobaculum bizertense DSM 18034]